MEKVTDVLVLVAAAEVRTTVGLIMETMVVPPGKTVSHSIGLPTSAVTKLAVAEVRVATSSVVEPSVKVTPPISHGGLLMPPVTPRPINFPLATALSKHSSICTQL